MFKQIGYLNYQYNNGFKKILSKIYFKSYFKKIDNNKYEILINNCNLNKRRIKKIKKRINANNIDIVTISNLIDYDVCNIKNSCIRVFNGKVLMKNLILQVLNYVFFCKNKNPILESICIAINNDKNKDIIVDLAHNFKYIEIVTDKIKKIKRLEKILEKNENIIYSISNNTKKCLKKAEVIINFDYNEDFFNKFNVNRNAIIINLNNEKIKMKNSFQGIIIENIEIDYNIDNDNILTKEHFKKSDLYESKILNMNYKEFNIYYADNKCKIIHLLGKSGNVLDEELNRA